MPAVAGFMPYGHQESRAGTIFLLFEEYESLKLLDYEKQTQEQAAQAMGVSRPTLTRIYMSAREKIATAFVEGRQIAVEGGKVELDGHWFVCGACGAVFSHPDPEVVPETCALCGSRLISRYILGPKE